VNLRKSLTLILSINISLILLVLIVSYTLWVRENYFRALDTALTFNMIKAEQLINEKGFEAVEPYLEIIETRVIRQYEQLPSIVKQQYPITELTVGKYVYSETSHSIIEELGLSDPEISEAVRGYDIYIAQDKNGTIYYLIIEFQPEVPSYWQLAESQLNQVWIVSFIVIVLLVITILMILRHIAKPIRRLNTWAEHLSREDLDRPLPSFEYRELDSLAIKIHRSLQEVDAISQRETQFLQYASHELRTPIAIIKSNTELLEQLLPDSSTATKSILQRLVRAGKTMHHLTETLLWLTRKEISTPAASQFSLTLLLTNTVDEHSYLLVGKKIKVELLLTEISVYCPKTLMSIVLANLIRNAMQHIDEGAINICINGNYIIIENSGQLLEKDITDGFGLGLKLVKQICQQLNWEFEMSIEPSRCVTTINIASIVNLNSD